MKVCVSNLSLYHRTNPNYACLQNKNQNKWKNNQKQDVAHPVEVKAQQNLKAKSKKDQAKQNYYKSNMVKQLRCNLRDNSIDVKPEWTLIKELTK